MSGQVILIEWIDAHPNLGWIDLDSLKSEAKARSVKTIGFLLEELIPDHISICQSIDSESHVDAVLNIPESTIISRQLLD